MEGWNMEMNLVDVKKDGDKFSDCLCLGGILSIEFQLVEDVVRTTYEIASN